MICKKCRTAYNEKTTKCPYCGNYRSKNQALKIIFGCFAFAVILLTCALYIYDKSYFLSMFEAQQPSVTSTPKPSAPNDPGQPTSTPIQTAESSDKTIFVMLGDTAAALEDYYTRFSVYANLVSKSGYLFEMTSNRYVTVNDLTETGMLSKSYQNEMIFLLFLRPADFEEFSEVQFSASNSLELFAACETKDGVSFVSKNNSGTLYRENYNELLDKYDNNHGELVRPLKGDKDYTDVYNALAGFLQTPGKIDMRYLQTDEKYAFAVISHEIDRNRLYSYALTRADDGFEIVMTDIEQTAFVYSEINKIIPDFSMELIPAMNIEKYSASLLTDYTIFEELLLNEGYIEESVLPFSYICATSRFAYIKTALEQLFVCSLSSNGTWRVEQCANYVEAGSIMQKYDSAPPYFILIQE